MNSESISLKRLSHKVGQNWYHIVLVPRCRYPVFKQPHQHKLMGEAIDWFCERHSVDLFAKEVMDDHVHLFVSCPHRLSILRLIAQIKGATSYYIRTKHPPLKRYKSLWSKGGMYRSVGTVSAEIVKKYINHSNIWQGYQKKLI